MLLWFIRMLLGTTLLGVAASPRPRAAQPYDSTQGPLAVRDTGLLVLHDDARGKDLQVADPPPPSTDDQPGPFPLVVFSHGMGGSAAAFASLSECLASHGYVVVHPTHADSVSLGTRAEQHSGRGTSSATPPAASPASICPTASPMSGASSTRSTPSRTSSTPPGSSTANASAWPATRPGR